MLMCLLISNFLHFVPKPLVLVSLSYTQGLQQSDLHAGSWPKFFLLPPIQQILKASSGPFYTLLHKSDHNFSHYYSLWYVTDLTLSELTQALTFCTSWNITHMPLQRHPLHLLMDWSLLQFKSLKRIWDLLFFIENSPQPLTVWRGWCF